MFNPLPGMGCAVQCWWLQSCPTPGDPHDLSPPGSPVHLANISLCHFSFDFVAASSNDQSIFFPIQSDLSIFFFMASEFPVLLKKIKGS